MSRFFKCVMLRIGLAVLCCASNVSAQEPISETWKVLRSVNDFELDTVRQLTKKHRYQEAIEICQSKVKEAPTTSLNAARWAVEHSRVLVSQQCQRKIFDDRSLGQVIQPVIQILDAYPQHPFDLFLRAQILGAEKEKLLYQITRSLASPLNQELNDVAVRESVQLSESIVSLIEVVNARRSRSNEINRASEIASPEDLNRLQQTLRVDLVSIALFQTDLMDHDSDEMIAAASRAEKLGMEAIATLPSGSTARGEVLRLRVEALIRMKQVESANTLLRASKVTETQKDSTPWRALIVRLLIERGQELLARDELVAYYKHSLEAMIRDIAVRDADSIEMDLALLQFFLAFGTQERIADCLRWVEGRGGSYARMRADALSLNHLKKRPGSEQNPSLVAARGRQLIRNGQLQEGAEILVVAASLPGTPDEGVDYAVEAAAVFSALKKNSRAGLVLREYTLKHASSKKAAEANLQALILISGSGVSDFDVMQDYLEEHLATWPKTESARKVSMWLYSLLRDRKNLAEAAIMISGSYSDPPQVDEVERIENAWHELIVDPTIIWDAKTNAFKRLLSQGNFPEEIPESFRKLSLLLLNASDFRESENQQTDIFEKAVKRLLVDGAADPNLSEPTEHWKMGFWLGDLARRLIHEADQRTSLREAVASALLSWDSLVLNPLERAKCLVWTKQYKQTLKLLEDWIQVVPDDIKRPVQAAELLGASEDEELLLRSADLWKMVSTGLPKGSPKWHEAKLSGVKALQKAGKYDAAKTQVDYLLLTAPGLTEDLRSKYQECID